MIRPHSTHSHSHTWACETHNRKQCLQVKRLSGLHHDLFRRSPFHRKTKHHQHTLQQNTQGSPAETHWRSTIHFLGRNISHKGDHIDIILEESGMTHATQHTQNQTSAMEQRSYARSLKGPTQLDNKSTRSSTYSTTTTRSGSSMSSNSSRYTSGSSASTTSWTSSRGSRGQTVCMGLQRHHQPERPTGCSR